MIYEVRQVTTYVYAWPVPFAHHILHMMPDSRDGQTVLASTVRIDPKPAKRTEGRDFFGNLVTRVVLDSPHEEMRVETSATVEVRARPMAEPGSTPPSAVLREAVVQKADFTARAPGHFLFASRYIPLDPATSEYAQQSFTAATPVLAGAVDLMHRINSDFQFDADATETSTLPSQAFALKRGVCQDFANIMIAGLRGIGLPAAYVSGYIRTMPPPGQPRLVGADATHAWVNVWCGEHAGWVGLDPTNALRVGVDHIVVAVGRDYGDVAPVGGVIVSSGDQKLTVSVDVAPMGVEP